MTDNSEPDRSETVELPAQDGVPPVTTGSEPEDVRWRQDSVGTGDSAGSWPTMQDKAAALASSASERPEVMVGAAFAGGLLAALILRRLAR